MVNCQSGELWDFAGKTNAENYQQGAIFAGQKSPNPVVFL